MVLMDMLVGKFYEMKQDILILPFLFKIYSIYIYLYRFTAARVAKLRNLFLRLYIFSCLTLANKYYALSLNLLHENIPFSKNPLPIKFFGFPINQK